MAAAIGIAIALIQPLAWELPYALGVALKKKKREGKGTYVKGAELASIIGRKNGSWLLNPPGH